jgi:type II secretory pathway component GspD/PulD (secretin)
MKAILLPLLLLAACQSARPAPAPARAESVEVVPLKYAPAQELAETLNRVLGVGPHASAAAATASTGPAAGSGACVVADPRTNSLLIRATPDEMARLLALVHKLDVQAR